MQGLCTCVDPVACHFPCVCPKRCKTLQVSEWSATLCKLLQAKPKRGLLPSSLQDEVERSILQEH